MSDRRPSTGTTPGQTSPAIGDDLLRAAGIDPARFAVLSEYEQRVVLRVAEQLKLARDAAEGRD